MSSAAQQNAMMLASLLGVGEAEAADRLERTVLVTAEPGWKSNLADELVEILGRTLHVVTDPDEGHIDLEVVIGSVDPRTAVRAIFADIDGRGLVVSPLPARLAPTEPHGLYGAAAVCAIAAAAAHAAIDALGLPDVRLPMKLNFTELGVPPGALDRPVVLNDAFVVGAGAVAHGFLRAARHLDVRGELKIVDPKAVKEGVLNRCLYLQPEDVGADKAIALAQRAQADFADLRLVPDVRDLREALRGRGGPPEMVFVTVDSRETRRSIQNEFPRRVVDASTTDVREVVVHSNVLQTDKACLACIYPHVPEEYARERAVAAGLGVDLDTVRKGFIDADAARTIHAKYPQIEPDAIVGTAFDTLFRQMCAEQALTTPEGRQVLAPFAFVSAWAGVLMAIETLRLLAGHPVSNYWRVDPWNVPVGRGRVMRDKIETCRFCSNPATAEIIRSLA